MRTAMTVALTLALAGTCAGGARAETPPARGLAELQARFESVSSAFDIAQAEELLSRARAIGAEQPSPAIIELEVRAALLVAELERLAFERLARDNRDERSEIGKRIDVTAKAGLARIESLPETSERWRLQADLVATMIRSDFRAKKYHKAFEEAVDHATRLDAENPHAWVSAAKPLVFAGPKQGQDLDEAVRLLGRALELEPGLESALLLRGLAQELRGDPDRAAADWRVALATNPDCDPARAGLERLAGESSR